MQPEINADPNAVIVIQTNNLPWEATEHPGVWQKVLERVNDPKKGRETSIVKFDANTKLPTEVLAQRQDILVVAGTYSDEHGDYGVHTFIRNQAGFRHTPSSRSGCVLFVKRRVHFRDETERIVIDPKNAKWVDFPHRSASVLHLYRDAHGIETARIGVMGPNGNIPTHDHAMGEESFTLEGCLKDEKYSFDAGTWFRFPIGVPHTPFTKDAGCKMLIREGDLVW